MHGACHIDINSSVETFCAPICFIISALYTKQIPRAAFQICERNAIKIGTDSLHSQERINLTTGIFPDQLTTEHMKQDRRALHFINGKIHINRRKKIDVYYT